MQLVVINEIQPVHIVYAIGIGIAAVLRKVSAAVAPVGQSSVGADSHGVIPARRDTYRITDAADGNGVVSAPVTDGIILPNVTIHSVRITAPEDIVIGAVAQLAMLIVAPGVDLPVGGQGIAGKIAGSDGHDVVKEGPAALLAGTDLLRRGIGVLDPVALRVSRLGMTSVAAVVIGIGMDRPGIGHTQLTKDIGAPGPHRSIGPQGQSVGLAGDHHRHRPLTGRIDADLQRAGRHGISILVQDLDHDGGIAIVALPGTLDHIVAGIGSIHLSAHHIGIQDRQLYAAAHRKLLNRGSGDDISARTLHPGTQTDPQLLAVAHPNTPGAQIGGIHSGRSGILVEQGPVRILARAVKSGGHIGAQNGRQGALGSRQIGPGRCQSGLSSGQTGLSRSQTGLKRYESILQTPETGKVSSGTGNRQLRVIGVNVMVAVHVDDGDRIHAPVRNEVSLGRIRSRQSVIHRSLGGGQISLGSRFVRRSGSLGSLSGSQSRLGVGSRGGIKDSVLLLHLGMIHPGVALIAVTRHHRLVKENGIVVVTGGLADRTQLTVGVIAPGHDVAIAQQSSRMAVTGGNDLYSGQDALDLLLLIAGGILFRGGIGIRQIRIGALTCQHQGGISRVVVGAAIAIAQLAADVGAPAP